MGRLVSTRALVALVALAVAAVFVEARITSSEVLRDDRKIILIARPFGFGKNGAIEVTAFDDKIFQPANMAVPNKSRLGFFITTAEAESQLEQDLSEGACVLDNENIERLFTLQEMDSQRAADGSFQTYRKIAPGMGGEYSLFFANCEPDVVVSFKIRVMMYNEGYATGTKDYLSAGEALLPTMDFIMFVCYALATVTWFVLLSRQWEYSNAVHVLMGALLLCKSLTLLSQGGMYHLIRTTGDADGWDIAYYVFTFFRGIMLFTVIVLIGTGWSFLKPFLADREKKVVMAVIPLQVFANVATIILDETGPSQKGWFTWRDIFHLVDIVCCCAILFPIVWSIKHLREASQTDGKAARNVVKLTLFRQFYVMVVSYIYFTRIVVYLLKNTVPYQYVWVSDAAGETATLLFYVMTGLKFHPSSNNPYFTGYDEVPGGDKHDAL